MNKYFKDIHTLKELRRQYKDLLKKFHPDNANGSTEATQEINAEYDKLFKVLKDRHESKNTENTSKQSDYNTNMYDWENDRALREVLQKIINFNGIEIEIIGQWIWCFNSKEYRKELKELGFKYAPKKYAWYFHTETFRKKSHKTVSLNDMRSYYGSTRINTEEKELLEA